jgi:hypothetical protein
VHATIVLHTPNQQFNGLNLSSQSLVHSKLRVTRQALNRYRRLRQRLDVFFNSRLSIVDSICEFVVGSGGDIFLTGSVARNGHTFLSDIDLMLVTSQQQHWMWCNYAAEIKQHFPQINVLVYDLDPGFNPVDKLFFWHHLNGAVHINPFANSIASRFLRPHYLLLKSFSERELVDMRNFELETFLRNSDDPASLYDEKNGIYSLLDIQFIELLLARRKLRGEVGLGLAGHADRVSTLKLAIHLHRLTARGVAPDFLPLGTKPQRSGPRQFPLDFELVDGEIRSLLFSFGDSVLNHKRLTQEHRWKLPLSSAMPG